MSRIRIIAGQVGGRFIQSPPKFTSRPTQERVREALFSSIAPLIADARFLDLFAGSGAVGIEALSRGVACAVFVEQNRGFSTAIQSNLASCGLRGEVITSDANAYLRSAAAASFDLIFADPPYTTNPVLLDTMPCLTNLARVLASDGLVIWEHSRAARWESPAHFTITKTKSFGDSTLTYLKKTGRAADI